MSDENCPRNEESKGGEIQKKESKIRTVKE